MLGNRYIQVVEQTNRKLFLEQSLVVDIKIPNHCGGYPIKKKERRNCYICKYKCRSIKAATNINL